MTHGRPLFYRQGGSLVRVAWDTRRVWILRRRIHHGLVGLLLCVLGDTWYWVLLGLLLCLHDYADRYRWIRDLMITSQP